MKIEEELKLYKALHLEGKIYVKTYSQDCDGVEAYYNYEFTSVDEYTEAYESFIDSLEGRSSWEIVSKEELLSDDECGVFGQGWDIN